MIKQFLGNWFNDRFSEWDRFWFAKTEPHTLCLLRLLSGGLMFYTHFVWSFDLITMIGPKGWAPSHVSHGIFERWGRTYSYAWTHFDWLPANVPIIWIAHVMALIVFALFTLGYQTRLMAVLACFLTISYSHRFSLLQYGLDQVNGMMALYLMLGPCGERYSIDAWLRGKKPSEPRPKEFVTANLAIRLLQIHLCIVYLYSGIEKMKGERWWDGSAVWEAVASFQYQSLDMTWLAQTPFLIAFMTHLTVFWEAFYPALIWPKATRWFTLTCAVLIHGGIGLAMGMPTFGAAMIFANLCFLSPQLVDGAIQSTARALHRLFGWEWAANDQAAPEKPDSKAKFVRAASSH
jgi:Vitamin K-dependent gamma-carboxylase